MSISNLKYWLDLIYSDFDSIWLDFDFYSLYFDQAVYDHFISVDGSIGNLWASIRALEARPIEDWSDEIRSLETKMNTVWSELFDPVRQTNLTLRQAVDAIYWDVERWIPKDITVINGRLTRLETAIEDIVITDTSNIEADIDTLWLEVFTDIPGDIDVLDGDIGDLWLEVFTNIPDNITDLDSELDDLNTDLTDKINDDIAGVRTLVGTVNTNLTSRINDDIATVNTRIGTVNTNLTSRINDDIAGVNARIGTVNTTLTNKINTDIAGVNTAIAVINTEIEDVIKTDITDLEIEMARLFFIIESRGYTPLSLLSAILDDQDRVYSDYRREWQMFSTKLIGEV